MGGAQAQVMQGVSAVFGGNKEAEAAQNAALARQDVARRQFQAAQQTKQQLIAAVDDPQEIRRFEKQLQAQERVLARQEKLISSIDPAIMEASQQALQLLRGEESKALKPVRSQRARQRQQLMNQLREQGLSPTSSAGIQALTRFDAQTDQVLAGAQQSQQQTLGGLLGAFTQARPDAQRAVQGLAGITNQRLQNRLGAISGGGQFEQSAFAPLRQSAGSEFVGDQIKGRRQFELFSGILNQGIEAGTTLAAANPGG